MSEESVSFKWGDLDAVVSLDKRHKGRWRKIEFTAGPNSWYAWTVVPHVFDPGDGYTHGIGGSGETCQEAVDDLRNQLKTASAWIVDMLIGGSSIVVE